MKYYLRQIKYWLRRRACALLWDDGHEIEWQHFDSGAVGYCTRCGATGIRND